MHTGDSVSACILYQNMQHFRCYNILLYPGVLHTLQVYYYHIITRKTQWDRPTEDDRDGDILMDIATPDIDEDETTAAAAAGQPHTPEDSPPSSPLSQVKHLYCKSQF